MNKQEQIEKLATALACGNCGQPSWDCPEDEGLKCYVKEASKPKATLLVNNGYINGVDFVEWLKSKYADLYYLDTFNRMDVFDIAEALQEYMKGE